MCEFTSPTINQKVGGGTLRKINFQRKLEDWSPTHCVLWCSNKNSRICVHSAADFSYSKPVSQGQTHKQWQKDGWFFILASDYLLQQSHIMQRHILHEEWGRKMSL